MVLTKERLEKYRSGECRIGNDGFKESDKGKYVVTGLVYPTLEQKLGRLVQVRLRKGIFESALVLIREPNGDLTSHHNQSFWIVPDKYTSELDELYKDVHKDDTIEHEYSIEGNDKVKGFLS